MKASGGNNFSDFPDSQLINSVVFLFPRSRPP